MSAQREGLFNDIVDKFKDFVADDERKNEQPKEEPPLTPQCCGPLPPGWPVVSDPSLATEGPVDHDADCPNHPDNLASEEVAS